MSDDRLAIWLYGTRVAVVERERRRMRLRYTAEALESFPGGTPLLSVTVPLSDRSFPNGVVGTLLDGVLPEGQMRLTIAAELGLRADDTFGLARELGRDCAGALVIQPDAAPAPAPALTSGAEPLTDDELARRVANLREAPLGVDDRVRISLAGVQEKLLLTRLSGGGWGRPVDGTPSTHILKPEIRGYPGTVENEAFCMRLAKYLGLAVAAVSTTAPAGRKLIVVARYDRVIGDDGVVERIHQEDFCQATGTPPRRKYEEDGGPSLGKVAALLASVERGALTTLLGAVTLNVAIGNGDAHAKNFSLLHDRSGALRFAPLYDLLSTFIYGDKRLAMYIDGVQRTDRVTADRLVNEATSWGMSRTTAAMTVSDLLERLPAAVERATDETPGVPGDLLELVRAQSERLRAT
ncbi:MAG TPA: type II toxin-antitoxin system HipA family toxin [Solirubrobacteraceae bacterium]|nr:type II toxin-antitoxin system HipA family toxin [Solirubrobacteraceae bacterium]